MGHLALQGAVARHWVPVLCYHRVLPGLERGARDICGITPEKLDAQMSFLAESGFQSLSLEEFLDMARGRTQLRKRCVLVTFDDGYVDNYRIAWPIARRHDIKINLFILVEFAGRTDPVILSQRSENVTAHIQKFPDLWRHMSWEELRVMKESGVSIGLHGYSHQKLIEMNRHVLTQEATLAIQIFKEELGEHPNAYALPFGSIKTFTFAHINLLKEFGFEMIFSSVNGRNRLFDKRLLFSRLMVHQKDDLGTFKAKLSGAYDFIGAIRYGEQYLWEFYNRVFQQSYL
jgi:peptidoglycan/xylan/chitin deacetylase (PgdA/CDA1 family)